MQRSSTFFGNWSAGIVLTIMAASIFCGLPYASGVFHPLPPTPQVEAPHAPPIKLAFNAPLYDEQIKLLTVKSGEKTSLLVKDLWSAPAGTPVSCATGFLAFTWIVRDPYPQGGEDLEVQHLIPMGGGRTETLAKGSTGSGTLGYCDELILSNNSLKDYRVEIRYASGNE